MSDISEAPVEDTPSDAAAPVDAEPAPSPASISEPIAAASEMPKSPTEEPPTAAAETAAEESTPEPPATPTAVAAVPAPKPCVFEAPASLIDALIAIEAAPVVETVPEPATLPAAAREPDAIPRFLTTELTAVEPEQPDSLIPFRAVAAAGALIGAVLLVYFWSSQEFGVAARPIIGATETAVPHAAAPKISASLAARQGVRRHAAGVRSGLPQPSGPGVRPWSVSISSTIAPVRPPPPVMAVKAVVTPVVPQSSAAPTIALPPAPEFGHRGADQARRRAPQGRRRRGRALGLRARRGRRQCQGADRRRQDL